MTVWYDQQGDLLEIIFEDAPATLEEVQDDVFEWRTRDGRVVGFAVMNFSKHNQERLTLPFEVKVSSAS